jgi:hypothetical protein
MLPGDIACHILDGHIAARGELKVLDGFLLELQLGYRGLMAIGAYKQYRQSWNRGRRKVGCFDFKIFDVTGGSRVPLVHTKVLRDALSTLDISLVEAVFRGADPSSISDEGSIVHSLCEVQLSMLEQEINWGDEDFQSKTYFLPSKGLRPRDFVMAYLRRAFHEPDFLKTVEPKRAASGTWGVLRPPIEKEWAPYREPKTSKAKPWLDGELLRRYREASSSMPDNPQYTHVYES